MWLNRLNKIFYFHRLRLASFDSRGKLVCSRSTGYQRLTLEKDQVSGNPSNCLLLFLKNVTFFYLLNPSLPQEYAIMNLDSRLLSFPLYVCCNFLYTSPHSDQRADPSEQESTIHSGSWYLLHYSSLVWTIQLNV